MRNDFTTEQSGQTDIDFQSLQTDTTAISGDKVEIPYDSFIQDAEMSRDGNDLVLKGPDGEIVIEGYFVAVPTPNIVADSGLTLTPQLVDSFIKSPLQFANLDIDSQTDTSPVGAVSELSGEAHVTRLDGTVEKVQIGTPIYQGDVVETNAEGAVNIVFIDETSFAVSEDARLSIDEYVFDPASAEGSTNFSVLKGMFVFTSGLIGREDPDDVMIETPMGSIGIRGTIIAGDVNAGEITVVEGAIVLTDFAGNEMTLANQFETARFNMESGTIEPMGQLAASDVAGKFASVSGVSGGLFSSINDVAGETATGESPSGETPSETQNTQSGGQGEADGNAGDAQGNEANNAGEAGDTSGNNQTQMQSGDEASSGESINNTTQNAGNEAQSQTTQTPTSGLNTGSGLESASLDNTAQSTGGTSTGTTSGTSANSDSTTTSGSSGTTGGTTQTSTNTNTTTTNTQQNTTTTASEPPSPNVLNGTTDPDNATAAGPSFIWTPTGLIAEDAAAGTPVATLGLSAIEAARYNFTIVGGAPAGAFAIDGSGAITIGAAGLIDMETVTQHDLQIEVIENGQNLGTFSTLVQLSDVNEFAPEIDAGAPTNAVVNEDANIGDSVATIGATDADASASLTYNITSGNGDGIFAISNTGEITIADTTNLDFEGGTTSYTLNLNVSDGTSVDTHSITININDGDNDLEISDALRSFDVQGGAGADTIIIHNPATFDINNGDGLNMNARGGASSDTLEFSGAGTIHFSPDGTQDRIEGIEIYDFQNADANAITMNFQDFMVDTNVGNTLTIRLDDADTLDLDLAGSGYEFSDISAGSVTYTNGSGHSVILESGNMGNITVSGASMGITIGDVMADGSIYAGIAPGGNDMLFLANPGGAAVTNSWNSGSTNFTITGATSTTDGEANTATLVGADSDNGTVGTQTHDAADYAANLNVHGHTDWYLPSLDEMNVLLSNSAAINSITSDALDTSGSMPLGIYWTSTENSANQAKAVRFSDGLEMDILKQNVHNTIAIRSESGPVNGNDITPDTFDLVDQSSVTTGSLITTAIEQIKGIDNGTSVSISGDASAEFRIVNDAGGTSIVHDWGNAPQTIDDGQYLQVRMTSSGGFGTTTTADITVGTFTDTITFTTLANNAPDILSFTDENPTYTGGPSVNIFSGIDVIDGDGGGQLFEGFTFEISGLQDGVDERFSIDGVNYGIQTSSGSISNVLGSKTLDMSITVSGNTATIAFTAASPANRLTETELETLLNDLSYRNNSPSPTDGIRTFRITEIQDDGGTADGGVDTETFAGITSTVEVVAPLDLNNLTTLDGFEITDDLGLSFGDNFYAGKDFNQDGFDDLLIGRGGDDMLFKLNGADGGYTDFALGSSPTGFSVFGRSGLLGDENGNADFISIGDVNMDGAEDYLLSNASVDQLAVVLGGYESNAFTVGGGGSNIFSSNVFGTQVFTILADGSRFVSTAVDANDNVTGQASLDSNNNITGTITDVYYDEANVNAVVIADGSIAVYNSADGTVIGSVISDAALSGAKQVVIVNDAGSAHYDAYVLTTGNTIVRIDDIYGGTPTPGAPMDLATIQASLDTVASNQYGALAVSPSESFNSIEHLFTDGTALYIKTTRPSEPGSFLKLDPTQDAGFATAPSVQDLGVNSGLVLDGQANTEFNNIRASHIDGTNMLAVVEDPGTHSLKLIRVDLTGISDTSVSLGDPVNGGFTFDINTDLYPSIKDTRQIILDDVGGNIAFLNKHGTITEFDISTDTNPLLSGVYNNPDYVGGTISYGPNGKLIMTGEHGDILTLDMPTPFLNPLSVGAGDLNGGEIVSIGDFNDDGLQDFAYSTPGNDTVTIVLGDAAGTFADTIQITGIDDGAFNEIPLISLGDIDGDGASDFAIAELGGNRLNIVSGNTLGTGSHSIAAASTYEIDLGIDSKILMSAASAGDFNGDGIDDLVLATKDIGSNIVDIFVLYGDVTPITNMTYADLNDPMNAFKMTYDIPSAFTANYNVDDFEIELSSAGDIDGDGLDDIAIGTPDSDNDTGVDSDGVGGTNDDSDGSAYVVYGQGTPDTYSGASVNSSMLGEIIHGDDTANAITQGNAAHTDLVMKGGAGDDNFNFISNDMDTHTIDGGAGFDILGFIGTGDVDFRNVTELGIQRIEQITMTGSGDNTMTLSVENLMNFLNSSDNGELIISTAGGGNDGLLIDHNGTGSDGGGDVGSIEAALESIFGVDSVSHTTDAGNSQEVFTIGSYDLVIDSALITNTTVTDVA